MVVPPLMDADVHLPVAVDARPSVEELERLEVDVLVCHHRHRRPVTMKLMPKRRKLSPNQSKTKPKPVQSHRHHC
jgi:hypothetical protein